MSIVTMALQYFPRFGSQRSMDKFSWRIEVRHMPSAGFTICRRHSLDHRKRGGPATHHQGTANSNGGTQAGSKLDKTNTMAIGREITGCKVEVDGHNVENVSEAVYLGVKFSEDGRKD